MTSTSRHLLMVCLVAWGHYRPGIACAAKLLEEANHLTITLPIPSNWIKEIDDEVAKYIPDIRDPTRDRLRIVPIGNVVQTGVITATFVAELFPFCANLFASTPYQQANGNVLSAIRQPDVCLLDVCYWDLLSKIRTFNAKTPVLVLAFGNITSTIREVGPEELGGVGDRSIKAKILAKETGKSVREAHIELYMQDNGQIINLIGLPPIYDYECHIKLSPQLESVVMYMYPKMYKIYRDCDGIITTSPHVFEPESNDAFRAYYEGSNRSYYIAGPLALTSIDQLPRERSVDKDVVKTFLDRMLRDYGERSVIYVCFGSAYWPLNDAPWKVFEVIHESQIPMILVHNSSRPPIPDSLRAKFEASDTILISAWAPQNAILGHRATAWFLTHCGQNSVLESLSHGMPMIAWPVELDQITNAIYIGDLKHKVGYELLEVLERDESKPLSRGYTPRGTLDAVENEIRTVLQNAFGPDGAEKRRNAEIFKEKISHLWDKDGSARLELRRFVKDYLSEDDSDEISLVIACDKIFDEDITKLFLPNSAYIDR